jgi:short-subunit dehydrogenase
MSHTKKRIVIVGATSAMAEQCARIWVARAPVELTLVGRDEKRTRQVSADLAVRSPESILHMRQVDFNQAAQISRLAEEVAARGAIDIVLIAHGSLPDQQQCQQDLALCQDTLEINGVSPALFAEAFAGAMEGAGKGTLAIIGSVAGDRGRKTNYVYGAAKGLVERYAQGLQHRLAETGVKVVLIKPGPTDTPMTTHLKQQGGKLASVEVVSQRIVKAIDQGIPVVYAPAKWALIMNIIRKLPNFIFNRLDI